MVVDKTGAVGGPQPIQPTPPRPAQSVETTRPAPKADQAEISLHARLLQKLHAMSDLRQDQVDRLRQQIADGSYDTEDKLRGAVDRLLEDL